MRCRRDTWSPCCKAWCAKESSKASAARAAVTSWRANAHRVTANDILRAAGTVDEADNEPAGSELLSKVVLPALSTAEQEFGVALSRINLEDMARDAEALNTSLFGRAAAARA